MRTSKWTYYKKKFLFAYYNKKFLFLFVKCQFPQAWYGEGSTFSSLVYFFGPMDLSPFGRRPEWDLLKPCSDRKMALCSIIFRLLIFLLLNDVIFRFLVICCYNLCCNEHSWTCILMLTYEFIPKNRIAESYFSMNIFDFTVFYKIVWGISLFCEVPVHVFCPFSIKLLELFLLTCKRFFKVSIYMLCTYMISCVLYKTAHPKTH